MPVRATGARRHRTPPRGAREGRVRRVRAARGAGLQVRVGLRQGRGSRTATGGSGDPNASGGRRPSSTKAPPKSAAQSLPPPLPLPCGDTDPCRCVGLLVERRLPLATSVAAPCVARTMLTMRSTLSRTSRARLPWSPCRRQNDCATDAASSVGSISSSTARPVSSSCTVIRIGSGSISGASARRSCSFSVNTYCEKRARA